MTLNERCPVCGGLAGSVRERTNFAVGKRSVLVEVDRFRCGECGEAFYSPDQMDAAQRSASNEVRRQDGLLMPEQIQAIRSKYRLTQTQFEQLLGVGPKTVVRWERGTVFQNGSTDELLRVLEAVPEAVAFLASRNGVQCFMGTAFHGRFAPLADVSVVGNFRPAAHFSSKKVRIFELPWRSRKRIKLQDEEQEASVYPTEEVLV